MFAEYVGHANVKYLAFRVVNKQIAAHIDALPPIAMGELVVEPIHPVAVQVGLAHRLAVGFGVLDFSQRGCQTHRSITRGDVCGSQCIVPAQMAARNFDS
jgi:hypothetical protein